MRITEAEYEQLMKNRPVRPSQPKGISTPAPDQKKPVQVKSGKQTKTEMEYGRMLSMEFPGCQIIPWGATLRMSNGHRYTPDFLVNGAGWMLLVEVKQRGKNGFRQNSYQRAKLAFDQCRTEFCNFTWRWSEKHNGIWTEHKY